MNASTATGPLGRSLEVPSWKNIASHVGAVLVALIFISSGVWKITDPFGWSRFLDEFLVPRVLSMPFTLTLGIAEAFGGVMILVPRFRRWGAILTSLLLAAFMGYIGLHYSQLLGKDCSCFPIVKRTVGPMFFVEDGAMLVAAILAGWWARAASGIRSAAVVLGALAVFSGVSYGVAVAHQTGTKAPDSVIVNGKPFSLQNGRVFLFFFDPECSHCNDAAKNMSTYHWMSDVQIVGIPTRVPQFGEGFMHDNKLAGVVALDRMDFQKLKATFPFGDPPYGVALENGREVGPVANYDDEPTGTEPSATLRKLGYIQ